MAIPTDDPRLNEVRVDPARRLLEPYERDDDGRIILSQDVRGARLLFVSPSLRVYDREALAEEVDAIVSQLADPSEQSGAGDATTTFIG